MRSCRKATTRTWGSWTEVARPGWRPTVPPPGPTRWRDSCGRSSPTRRTSPEGLAIADFDLIDRGAQRLSLVSEDASWQVLQTEDYLRHSVEFRRSCDALRKSAREKNLDGAALAWMEVTMRCIQCHKYVRDEERPAC